MMDEARSEPITPGPDGIWPTNPTALIPWFNAICASSALAIQQTFIWVFFTWSQSPRVAWAKERLGLPAEQHLQDHPLPLDPG